MYEQFYGFSEKPFQLTPDPRFFYASESHDQAMAYLRYGLQQKEGFIVVTGPVGTGKSTLVRNLLNEMTGTEVVAAQLVSTNVSPLELLQMVVREFGIKVGSDSKADHIKAIETYLRTLHRRNERALLVVDEAQNLPADTLEELRMLSNFQLNHTPLFQSFLLGQEELKDVIEQPGMEQFRQRVIASCHLQPLTVDELRAYVEYRLHRVGWQGCPQIDESIYAEIHRHTEGVPRRINLFVDRILLHGYSEELTVLGLLSVNEVARDLKREPARPRPTTTPVAAAASSVAEAAPARAYTSVEQLLEVASYLDSVMAEKLVQLKQLDETIAARRAELQALESVPGGE